MSDNPNQGASVRIGRWSILPDGTRKPLSPLADDADADQRSPIPFRDLDEHGQPILFPADSDDPGGDGDDWRGDRERDRAENDPHRHRTAR